MTDFNATHEYDPNAKTLSELRTSMMRRLGFSAMAANPPPGMADLLDEFLQDAQRQIYRRYKALRTERFFRWTMTPNERYYGIRANDEQTDDPAVEVFLEPHSISWVGVQDLNDVWYPLIQGIPPEAYTRADLTPGWPTRYEIRQAIEVFPAPQEAYTLRIKGHFGVLPFSADEDRTTVDPDAVFLMALGNAKAHYGQPDANNLMMQAATYIASLVGGSHHTARYVPGPRGPREAMTPPRMTSFDDE